MKHPHQPIVFVVDDNDDFRSALKWLIESVGLAVELYSCAEDFLEANCASRPGCLLLDMRMPGIGGMKLLEELQSGPLPSLPTIVITGHADVPTAVQALKLGAFDYIEKPTIHQQLLDRIREALALDAGQRSHAAELEIIRLAINELTEREYQVLELLATGKANKEVAQLLALSERTVEKYRACLMKKMQADSLAALVRMWVLHQTHTESTPKA